MAGLDHTCVAIWPLPVENLARTPVTAGVARGFRRFTRDWRVCARSGLRRASRARTYNPVPVMPRLLRWDLPMIERSRCKQSIFVLASAGLAVALLSQSAWAQISGQLTRAEILAAIKMGTEAAMRAGIGGKVTPF